ncbi:MAG: ATP-dependent DNA ligase [Candidatus Woesearchaeota archaeon]
MRFSRFARLLDELEGVSGRYEKINLIAPLLAEADDASLRIIPLLLVGRFFASYDERETGISSKSVLKALEIATGVDAKRLEDDWRETGDLGLVAEKHKASQSSLVESDPSIAQMHEAIVKLSELEGSGSQSERIKRIAGLLSNAKTSVRALTRLFIGDLRAGVGEGAIRDAVLIAFCPPDDPSSIPRELSDRGQRTLDILNDLGEYAVLVKHHPDDFDERAHIRIGRPIKSMLAIRSTGLEDATQKSGLPVYAEPKYDGFRVQIHKRADEISLFTRRLESVTAQFPDVVRAVRDHVNGDVILDCEVLGYDRDSKRLVPFQDISQRIRRKHNIDELAQKLPVVVKAFDILYRDGEDLLTRPFEERRELLESAVEGEPWVIEPSRAQRFEGGADLESFYAQCLAEGYEGIMLKTPGGMYKPGARVGQMIKVKPTLETVDAVVVGGEYGEGKRSAWIASFLVAVRSPDGFVEVGRVGSGLKEKDEQGTSFGQVTEILEAHIIETHGRSVRVEPTLVVEVASEEIQKSDAYNSGYALRFPRIIRIRDDRSPDEATTLEDLEEMYRVQRGRDRS